MKEVVLVRWDTEDGKGVWSIYGESGDALEHDFTSEEDAIEYATDRKWKLVDNFNCK